jgi:hypothetical protein
VFSQPQIEDLFKRYVVVRLYCDTVPPGAEQVPDAAGAVRLRKEKFNNEALPFYAIVRPTGGEGEFETVRVYGEGLIRDVDAFARFLREPLEGGKPPPGSPPAMAKR